MAEWVTPSSFRFSAFTTLRPTFSRILETKNPEKCTSYVDDRNRELQTYEENDPLNSRHSSNGQINLDILIVNDTSAKNIWIFCWEWQLPKSGVLLRMTLRRILNILRENLPKPLAECFSANDKFS